MTDGPTFEGDKSSLSGHPVQIITINDEEHTFELDEEAMGKILNDNNIRDKPICVVSVAGKNYKRSQVLNLCQTFTFSRCFPKREVVSSRLHVEVFEQELLRGLAWRR